MSTFYVLPEVGQEVVLHTHLIVREDSHTLYGFSADSERSLFRSLIRVNGVGARLALTILSGISAREFVRCVEFQDTAALTKLPGVGKKTAERLIVEMRDRLKEWEGGGAGSVDMAQPGAAAPASSVEDALSALIALGYKAQDAGRMVRGVGDSTGISSEELIRRALQGTVKA